MLFALNYIKETMYYWGDNYKMQTSHTLCSRPNGTVLCTPARGWGTILYHGTVGTMVPTVPWYGTYGKAWTR